MGSSRPHRIRLPFGSLLRHAPEGCLVLEGRLSEKLGVDFTLDEPGVEAARVALGGRARHQGLPR